MASNQSHYTADNEVNENIDLDETEQSLLEVQFLKRHISAFESKIAKSQKVLSKRTEESAKNMGELAGAKIYE